MVHFFLIFIVTYSFASACPNEVARVIENASFLLSLQDPKLNRFEQGELVVARMRQKVKEIYSTSGIKNQQEMKELLHQLTAQAAQVRDLILHDRVNFTVQVSTQKMKRLLETDKLSNIHYDNPSFSSDVHYDIEALRNDRNAIEGNMIGLSKEEFSALNDDLKPTYGTLKSLSPEIKSPFTYYGDIELILRKDRIRSRTTWSPGDSMERHGKNLPREQKKIGARGNIKAQRWDNYFIPWENRELMIPALLMRNYNGEGISRTISTESNSRLLLFAQESSRDKGSKPQKLGLSPIDAKKQGVAYEYAPLETVEGLGTWPTELNEFSFQQNELGNYSEIQIWGGISSDDIEYINIQKGTNQQLYEKLINQGYDVRFVD